MARAARRQVECAALALTLLFLAPARAAPPAPAWFVPAPPKAGSGSTVDTRSYGSFEDITVTAPRRAAPVQRNPHGDEVEDFQPARSLAASPHQGNPAQSSCQSAYQTVAGQPATGMDMISMGGGGC